MLRSRLIVVSVSAALGCLLFVGIRSWSRIRRGLEREHSRASQTDSGITAAHRAPGAPPLSFEQRLRESYGAGRSDAAAEARRAAILIEWLAADRNAAMRFLSHDHYKDLWLPGLTKAVGANATPAELLDIANGSDHPYEAVFQVGRWDSPGAINELAGLMPSVSPSAAGPTAGAIANLLAGVNVDRAMAFAMAQATDQERSFAVASVMSEMASTPNGDAAIRAWYASLPAALQESDPVLAAYGDSIWATDPAAALQTLQGIQDPQQKMFACLALAKNTASASPETAIAAIYESGLPPVGIYNHVNQILQNWYAVNPQAAASFLSTTQIIPPADLPKYAPIVAPSGGGKG